MVSMSKTDENVIFMPPQQNDKWNEIFYFSSPFDYAEDYIDEVCNDDDDLRKNQTDDWEGGLTFIAKSSGEFNNRRKSHYVSITKFQLS